MLCLIHCGTSAELNNTTPLTVTGTAVAHHTGGAAHVTTVDTTSAATATATQLQSTNFWG